MTAFPGALDSFQTASDGVTIVSASDRNNVQDALVALEKNAFPVVNVKTFQASAAKGDGATDDTAAIQAALDVCRVAGGGTVYLPAGTYMLAMASRTGGFAGNACALMYPPNTTIMGSAAGPAILKLKNSQSGCTGLGNNLASVLSPYNVNQEQVSFRDLIVDGNAGNQTDTHNGILVWRQRGVKLHRVRVMNCRGTANSGGAAETNCYYVSGSTDVSHIDCDAIQTAGSVSNGFAVLGSTHVDYLGCRALSIGSGAGIGFGFNVGTSSAGSREVVYTACHAYLCGSQGFHIDASNVENVVYQGCVAGGTASDQSSGQQYPFTSASSLGNGYGFVVQVAAKAIVYSACVADNNTNDGFNLSAATVLMVGCTARNNGGSGISVGATTPTLRVVGGDFEGNTGFNILVNSSATPALVRISGNPILSGGGGQYRTGGVTYASPPTNVTAPAVPATTVALTSPFSFNATVHVTGGTVTVIAVNGTATGLTAGTFRVPAGGTITLTYTVAPTWTWYLE